MQKREVEIALSKGTEELIPSSANDYILAWLVITHIVLCVAHMSRGS